MDIWLGFKFCWVEDLIGMSCFGDLVGLGRAGDLAGFRDLLKQG